MIYVGIDAASKKHDFAIMNSNGEFVTKPTTIRVIRLAPFNRVIN